MIAVTGATGAIGARLVKHLLSQGHGVAAICRPNSRNISKLDSLDVKIIECDADDYAVFDPKTRADIFIHLAWEGAAVEHRDDVYLQWQNAKNTLGAVELARKMNCEAFVFATSQAEIGITENVIDENTPPFPESAYGAAKLAAGQLSLLQCQKYGVRHCRARILSVFGEEDDDSRLLNYVAKSLVAGEKPSLTKCEQMWDFVYIEEACKQLLAIAKNGKDGAIYQVCGGKERPLREYVEMIRDAINPELPLGFGEKEYYPHQPMRLAGDISKLERDTGYRRGDGADVTKIAAYYQNKQKER